MSRLRTPSILLTEHRQEGAGGEGRQGLLRHQRPWGTACPGPARGGRPQARHPAKPLPVPQAYQTTGSPRPRQTDAAKTCFLWSLSSQPSAVQLAPPGRPWGLDTTLRPCGTLSPPSTGEDRDLRGSTLSWKQVDKGEQGMRPARQWDEGDGEAGAGDCSCQEGLCFPRGTSALTLGPWAREAAMTVCTAARETCQPRPPGRPPDGEHQPWAEATRGPAAARPCTDHTARLVSRKGQPHPRPLPRRDTSRQMWTHHGHNQPRRTPPPRTCLQGRGQDTRFHPASGSAGAEPVRSRPSFASWLSLPLHRVLRLGDTRVAVRL